jgi:RNA polymerase sigma-70 factor, ECF subfamily
MATEPATLSNWSTTLVRSAPPLERSGEGAEHGVSDRTLMEGIRDGHHASFRILLLRYWGPLLDYASRFTERGDEAEDVVQETFVRVWRQRSTWTPTGGVDTYLYRITRNLGLNAGRDRKARQRREELGGQNIVTLSSRSCPADDFEGEALRSEVELVLAQLPERRREVFILSRFYGLTYQEIADTLSVSPQTVANHMSAALADLRVALSQYLHER